MIPSSTFRHYPARLRVAQTLAALAALAALALAGGCGSAPSESTEEGGSSGPAETTEGGDDREASGSDTRTGSVEDGDAAADPALVDAQPIDTLPNDTRTDDTPPADTPPADTRLVDAVPSDGLSDDVHADEVPDRGDSADPDEPGDPELATEDTGPPDDRCAPPLRIRPGRGPVTGGTVVEVTGADWYIGALGWWLAIDEPVLGDAFTGPSPQPCTLEFVTQPHEAGSYPVRVWYGGPEGDEPGEVAGTFTFVGDAPAVSTRCTSDLDCLRYERCHLGLGGCVVDRCHSAFCDGSWAPGACDALRGCVGGAECADDRDCRLLYSSCSCVAVPGGDRRSELDPCTYEDCAACDSNRCAAEGVRAACESGVCVVAR